MSVLGDSFSRTLTARADQKVITTGPYSFVRHPGYLANLLIFTATAILVGSNVLIIGVCWTIFGYCWSRRIANEEAMLRTEIGKPYTDYCSTVKSKLIIFLY